MSRGNRLVLRFKSGKHPSFFLFLGKRQEGVNWLTVRVSDVILKGGDQRVERPSCCRVSSEFVVSCFYLVLHYSFKSLEEINNYKFVNRVRVRCLAVRISLFKGDPLGV